MAASIALMLPHQALAQEGRDSLDIEVIQEVFGGAGTVQDGEYKITIPQNDLDVTVDGFRINPPMGLGSWAAFTAAPDGAVVMGDLVVEESEIGAVEQALVENGLTITGLHNHFVREDPGVMFMHIGGTGPEDSLARAVEAVFGRIAELRGGDPSEHPAPSVPNTLDVDAISRTLGHSGEMNGGVYKVTIGRPEVDLRAHGTLVSSFLGFNTWAAWQGSPERAAVSGDFTMLEHEVAPVIESLVEHGIEVVAVHNHMVHEEPRVFFLHYWGVGPAPDLAQGLRAALESQSASRN